MCSSKLMVLLISLHFESVIVTVDWLGEPNIIPVGSEDGSMVRKNSSLSSSKLSVVMLTLNKTIVLPAGNVTLYGPKL